MCSFLSFFLSLFVCFFVCLFLFLLPFFLFFSSSSFHFFFCFAVLTWRDLVRLTGRENPITFSSSWLSFPSFFFFSFPPSSTSPVLFLQQFDHDRLASFDIRRTEALHTAGSFSRRPGLLRLKSRSCCSVSDFNAKEQLTREINRKCEDVLEGQLGLTFWWPVSVQP